MYRFVTWAGSQSVHAAVITPTTSRCHLAKHSPASWSRGQPSTILRVSTNAGKYKNGELRKIAPPSRKPNAPLRYSRKKHDRACCLACASFINGWPFITSMATKLVGQELATHQADFNKLGLPLSALIKRWVCGGLRALWFPMLPNPTSVCFLIHIRLILTESFACGRARSKHPPIPNTQNK